MDRKTTEHLGGEEWRDLDRAPEHYDPERAAAILPEARRRLRQHRMAEAEVRLIDRAGRPRPGVRLAIEQVRHAFPFGEQLWSLDAMARDGEWETGRARAWRERFVEVFNAANNLCYWTERPRNDASKTEDRQGEPRVENFARTVDWCLSAGLLAKGHPLFWSIPKCVPEWVQRYPPARRWLFAEARVRSLVARFRGRVALWDAVNEPMWEATLDRLQERHWPHIEPIPALADMVGPVLRWCREEDPEARFLVNDYGMELDFPQALRGNDGSEVQATSQRRRYVELFQELLARGEAPDGIGLQSHSGWVSHEHQWRIYDQFAATGLPLHITEFWATTKELKDTGRYSEDDLAQLQAEYVANYLTCAFAHPAIEGFFFWGIMGAAFDWRERSGHEPRPVWERLRGLIRGEWWTRTEAVTDGEGVARFRGFLGDFTVREPLAGGLQRGHGVQLRRGSPNRFELEAAPTELPRAVPTL